MTIHPITLELSTRLPINLAETIIEVAAIQDRSVSSVLAEALTDYFQNGKLWTPLPGRRIPITTEGVIMCRAQIGRSVCTLAAGHWPTTPHMYDPPNPFPAETATLDAHVQKELKKAERRAHANDVATVHTRDGGNGKPLHWTQRPENKKKVSRMARKGARTRTS